MLFLFLPWDFVEAETTAALIIPGPLQKLITNPASNLRGEVGWEHVIGTAHGFPGTGLNSVALGSPSLPCPLFLTSHPSCLGEGLWWLGRVTTGAGAGQAGSGSPGSAFGEESPQEGRKDVVFFYLSLKDPLGQRQKPQRLTGTREVT